MIKKKFAGHPKLAYGRPHILYLLNDLERVTDDKKNSREYVRVLSECAATETKVLDWYDCVKNLTRDIEEDFDLAILIGRFGSLIGEDLKNRGVTIDKTIVFGITRLSDDNWKRIAYVNYPKTESLKEQLSAIKSHAKNSKNICIVDDVTYSGATRKSLDSLRKFRHLRISAIDLVTIQPTLEKENRYYDSWYSGFLVNADPYPTLGSDNQADVMNVSEFLFLTENIGWADIAKVDRNHFLLDGNFEIVKKSSYTDNPERTQICFGDNAGKVIEFTKRFRQILKPINL